MSTTRQTTEQTLPQTKSKTVFSALSALVAHPTKFAFYSTHFPKAVSVVPANGFLSLFQNPPSFCLFGSICCFNNFLAYANCDFDVPCEMFSSTAIPSCLYPSITLKTTTYRHPMGRASINA